jgi:hypothetical protein
LHIANIAFKLQDSKQILSACQLRARQMPGADFLIISSPEIKKAIYRSQLQKSNLLRLLR